MTIEVCTGDGLIDPSAFVCKSADLDTSVIEGSATSLEGMGTGLVEKVSTISTTWAGIGASYQAPEQESVYAAISPATNAASDVETSFSSAAGYLRTYAEELEGVKTTLKDLEDRAAAFRQEALRGYNVTVWDAHGLSWEWATTDITKLGDKTEHISWTEHGPARDKNEELLAEYAAIIETVSAAATTCAAGLETLSTGSYVTEDEAITAEAIMASTELPWGYPADEDRNCSESVAHGAGNFWHGTWTGAASLIGRDPVSGEWGWDKAGAAWGGLGNFALSTAVVLSPTTWAVKLVAPGSEADQWFDDRVNVAATGWGSLIGWDHQAALAGENGFHAWEEDAVATGTETLANIGTFFIPGANIAKGVSTAGRVGSIVTRAGAFAADFAIPGGSLAVGLATRGIRFSPDGLRITPYVGATGVVDALAPTGGVPPVSNAFGLEAPGSTTLPGTGAVPGTGTVPGAGAVPGTGTVPGTGAVPGTGTVPGTGAVPGTGTLPGTGPGSPTAPTFDPPPAQAPDGPGSAAPGGDVPRGDVPGGESPRTGAPVNTPGVEPSSIDPHSAHRTPTDVGVDRSAAFDEHHSARSEQQAIRHEALETRNEQVAALNDLDLTVDVDGGALNKDNITATIDELNDQLDELDLPPEEHAAASQRIADLEVAARAEREAFVAQVDASEQMGDQAARDAIAAQGGAVVVPVDGAGPGTFDQIGLRVGEDGTQTLIVAEAKGGSARLSTTGRILPDGTTLADGTVLPSGSRAAQGSTLYFNDVFRNDANLAAYLRDNPALAAGLADGSVRVDYQLVKASPGGSISVQRLGLNPAELNLGLPR
ncbi:hypothetical protein [Pseudoclavibacter sp. RFBG4]|uniref:hypothetical protein n=1 Tax=Pseudoclavibacter sp. RFBG4 TaxID=2080575 RepID=UPI0015E46318|nr:hypothetical protein [Pseudoclavibacter sp. RFBG4]